MECGIGIRLVEANALACAASCAELRAAVPELIAIGNAKGGAMTVQSAAAAALALALAASPAGAGDFSGDIPTLREFLNTDKSYTAEERARAEAAFEALKSKAGDLSLADFNLSVARIAAISMNGHTMSPPGVWPHRFNRIPLEFHAFADGVRVIHTPDDMREYLGARVVSIEGRDVAELTAIFGDYFGARAGKRNEWAPFFLESPALLKAAGLADSADRIEAVFELPGGETTTRLLDSRLDPPAGGIYDFFDNSRLVARAVENVGGAAPLYLINDGEAFRSAPLAELDAWFIQLRINKSYYEQKIDAFIKCSLKDIERAKPEHLVVDLRLDGGGDLNTTRAFMQKLPELAPGLIFIITSGRTFSAGIASAGYLKQSAPDRVFIVGEPIGDFLEFYAEGNLV